MPTCKAEAQKSVARDFHLGTALRAYEYLGVHREGAHYTFRVWAPRADAVFLCGDFNGWDPVSLPMERVTEEGVWERRVARNATIDGSFYKYRVVRGERAFYKADPYGFSMQRPPDTASIVCSIEGYPWRDAGWLSYRASRFTRERATEQAINVYEVHLGSWMRNANWESLSYVDLARELAPYLKQMGYTHVQIMPICEYPYDGSWGYQISGFFAPTARSGAPQDLMRFVDAMHEAGIGVLLDWIPAYLPRDEHGLVAFDGEPLYECAQEDCREQGMCWFDGSRPEVRSFLLSNAIYWIEKFHFDGIHVSASEAIAQRRDANGEVESFLGTLNECLCREHPDVMTVSDGADGLGFTLAWNREWAGNALEYVAKDPLWRKFEHGRIADRSPLFCGGRGVLSLSHNEVVHGRRSLLERMPGVYRQRFSNLRVLMTYQMTFPGKKLTFMGTELGQICEWDSEGQVEWLLGEYELHAQLQAFSAELGQLYLENSPLWELDSKEGGFAWIDASDADRSIYSYRRVDAAGRELLILLNFTPVERTDYALGVPAKGGYEEVFCTDWRRFGGSQENERAVFQSETDAQGREAIRISLPPLSARILRGQG